MSVSFVRISALICAMIAAPLGTATGQQQLAVDKRASASERADAVLAKPVTVQLSNMPLRQALHAVTDAANVRVQYHIDQVDAIRVPRSVSAVNESLGTVLESLFAGTNLRAVPVTADAITIRTFSEVAPATDGIIVGRVLHAGTKQPIVGATVFLDDAQKGVSVGSNGEFRLTAAAGEHRITVRALGFVRQVREIVIAESETASVEILLAQSTNVLNEVVVTGTVVATERKAIPNPITVITAEDIERRGISRIEEFFRGEIPGVMVPEFGTEVFVDTLGAMASSQIYARGVSGLAEYSSQGGRANPLKTYVDGVEMLDPAYLGTIDPQSIDRIEIVTGPQAATIYGSGAMGGVMQIFTKKGKSFRAMELMGRLRIGMMENSMSSSLTPTHSHTATVTGGAGVGLSYSGSMSYRYSGQWQPDLFTRSYGGSLGGRFTVGVVTVSGSASLTSGKNGTAAFFTENSPQVLAKVLEGEWIRSSRQVFRSGRIGSNQGQTFSLNVDARQGNVLQHTLSIGRNQLTSSVLPQAPNFAQPKDTLFQQANSVGHRTTFNYSATAMPPEVGIVSSTIVVGGNGSDGQQLRVDGCTVTATATSFIGCYAGGSPSVSRPISSAAWGGFGRVQIGLLDRIFLTGGLRVERSPAYGKEHKLDWTPMNGATIALDFGGMTIKLLGSYGRATKAPQENMRLSKVTRVIGTYDISEYESQRESPDLRPEYSRGPQGGVEVYYRNHGYLTLNRYRQRISDIIQGVPVDSINAVSLSSGSIRKLLIYQYINFAEVQSHGWESTMGVNIGVFSVKGTYSWADSRIAKVNPRVISGWAGDYYAGGMFYKTPSHSGNITLQYASGGTSVLWGMNFTGASLQNNTQLKGFYDEDYYDRIGVYVSRKRWNGVGDHARPGYAKSHMNVQHRVNSWMSITADVSNLTNNGGSEGYTQYPTLGRTTWLGASLRFPR